MILYKGELPHFHFKLEGYTYLGDLSESLFEDCQLIFTQHGFYEYAIDRINKIKGTLRCLVNIKTTEVRAFSISTQMRLTAANQSNYELNARFFFPIEMLKATDFKKSVLTHVLACLCSYQGEIVKKMSEVNGAWFDHNQELYDQFCKDESIEDISPKFFPQVEDNIHDVFTHTNVGLTVVGKRIIEAMAVFCQDYELPYTDQLKELADEFELPVFESKVDTKRVA